MRPALEAVHTELLLRASEEVLAFELWVVTDVDVGAPPVVRTLFYSLV